MIRLLNMSVRDIRTAGVLFVFQNFAFTCVEINDGARRRPCDGRRQRPDSLAARARQAKKRSRLLSDASSWARAVYAGFFSHFY